MRICAGILVVLTLSAGQTLAEPYRLAPYKDELFAYPKILESSHDGAYLEVEYDRPRDLYGRDTEPGAKVNPKYVSLATQSVEADLTLDIGGTAIRYIGAGKTDGNAKAIVVFVHGYGVSRFTGTDDWIHGGNFNRIKNLMMLNGGVYLSPSLPDFGRRGADTVATLVLHYAALSPGAPVILACASLGGRICWRLVRDPDVAPLLGGIMLFDAKMDDDFVDAAGKLDPAQRLPIHISHSREDTTMGWTSQRRFFRQMKAAMPDYPIKYVLFSAGTHGLSLRMTDWRQAINWMLSVRDGLPQ